MDRYRCVDSANSWVRRLTRGSAAVSCVAVYIMLALLFVEVTMRNLLHRSTLVADEIGAYLLAVVTFMGLAYAFQEGAHIRLTLVISRLPPRAQRLADGCALAFSLAVATVLARWGWCEVIDAYVYGRVSWSVLRTPQCIPRFFMAFGLTVLALQVLASLVLKLATRGDPQCSQPQQ